MYRPPALPEANTTVRKVSYTVQRGDTLPRIAQRYKVSTDDLRTWNKIGRLAAGQHLVIQVNQTVPVKSGKPATKKRATKAKT
jgi:LysM repeat protein